MRTIDMWKMSFVILHDYSYCKLYLALTSLRPIYVFCVKMLSIEWYWFLYICSRQKIRQIFWILRDWHLRLPKNSKTKQQCLQSVVTWSSQNDLQYPCFVSGDRPVDVVPFSTYTIFLIFLFSIFLFHGNLVLCC